MADFSKQYDEKFAFGMQDFDIMEIFDSLEDGKYISAICEGFGFIAIAKNLKDCDEPLLAFSAAFAKAEGYWTKPEDMPEPGEDDCVWVRLSIVLQK